MFRRIRRRLLIANLVVLTSVLVVFVITVRTVFVHIYRQELIDELTALAQGARTTAELEGDGFKIRDDFSTGTLIKGQSLQWFNAQRHLVTQAGEAPRSLPFMVEQSVQSRAGLIAVTLPIYGTNHRLIGYVRASQTLTEFDEHIGKLDLGLGSGILLGLLFSSLSGLWLTRQAMQPVESSYSRLKQFTADASHELRSPIMAIQANAEIALKYSEGIRPEDAERFQAVISASGQMQHLTEDLLLLARTEQTADTQPEVLDLSQLLKDLVQLYMPRAECKRISLKTRLTAGVYVVGDENQLNRLFTNLLANALKYTPGGGTVEVVLRQHRHHIFVEVRDTGIGIAPEHIERVFDRFWQAEQSRSFAESEEGLGLGLAIAAAIAACHHGKIQVQSQLGQGSTFTVYLPAAATHRQ